MHVRGQSYKMLLLAWHAALLEAGRLSLEGPTARGSRTERHRAAWHSTTQHRTVGVFEGGGQGAGRGWGMGGKERVRAAWISITWYSTA